MRPALDVAAALTLVGAMNGCGGSGHPRTVVRTITAAPTTVTAASPPASTRSATSSNDCARLISSSSSGPPTVTEGTCTTSTGTKLAVVKQGRVLRLKTLTARVTGVHLTDSVSAGGGISATARGTFVVINLAITNKLSTPQQFDPIGNSQTALIAGGSKTYSESFNAENQADQQSFVSQSHDVQPDETQTGDVVFDLPGTTLARARSRGAGLVIVNFGDTAGSQAAGLIVLSPFG